MFNKNLENFAFIVILTSHNIIVTSPTTVGILQFDQNRITPCAYVLIMDGFPDNLFSDEKIATETIKWTLGATGTTKHEIVSPILTKFELGNVVAHCLTVMHKIDACVGNHPANRFALYMDLFPCTLSLPHVAAWDTVLIDHHLAIQDKAGFLQAI
jgi:hypothetical protein